ncbi:protein sel-1 homolog 1-like isoform X8 [Leucoraja erinacea]|uniref:protein sel-1 homolog 1-like isoform X8 n=1 Tax=Leucoraja erinaceus TaxID=7782 RepID=UPI002455AF24|nr:protein sel-1 homolog 1-like isoform X8 [Leucoraja erinacea]
MAPHKLLLFVLLITTITPPSLANTDSNVTQEQNNQTEKEDVESEDDNLSLEPEELKRYQVNVELKGEPALAQNGQPAAIAEEVGNNAEILPEANTAQQETVKSKEEQEIEDLYNNGTKILKRSRDKNLRKEGYKLLVKAADLGSTKAMERIAYALLFGDQLPQNVTAARDLFDALAENGSHKAQTALGFMYATGIGGSYNQPKALVYYTFAALGGNFVAHMILGYRYLNGINLPQHCEAALVHYRTAAKYVADNVALNGETLPEKVRLTERAGNFSSNGQIMELDLYQYFQLIAEKGDLQSQVGLGQLHLTGGKGIEQDFKKAFYYLSKAAEGGSANALGFLGKMYSEGNEAVPQSNEIALIYYRMAAERDNPIGLTGLGLAYLYGKGVSVLYKNVCERGQWTERFLSAYFAYKENDIDSAFLQYLFLAEQGYETAQSNTAHVLEYEQTSLNLKIDCYHMALIYWNRAAAQGYSYARIKLGDYYFYGRGTKVDYETAAIHYRLAAEQQRSAQAMFNLAYMYEYGLGTEQDLHLARRFYNLAAETSTDAYIPVFLALFKLGAINFIHSVQYTNLSEVWKQIHLDRLLRRHWDLCLIMILSLLLAVLTAYRHG